MSRLRRFAVGLVLLLIVGATSYFGWDIWQGNMPINFYGRLVDEDGHGLSNVKLGVSVNYAPRDQMPPILPLQNHEIVTKNIVIESDKDGYFQIHPGSGSLLNISSISEDGKYVVMRGTTALRYYYGWYSSVLKRHDPNPNNPVVIYMRVK